MAAMYEYSALSSGLALAAIAGRRASITTDKMLLSSKYREVKKTLIHFRLASRLP